MSRSPEGESYLEPAYEVRPQATYASTRRVFRIIDRVSRGGDGLAVKALAQELGISLSTCYHLLSILVDEGYIEKLPHQAGYRLGPAISLLHERARRTGFEAVVAPIIRDLSQLARSSAYFAVLEDEDVVVTHVHTVPDSSPVGVAQGFRGPAHALALGKVLIAAGGIEAIDRYIDGRRLDAYTSRTITDPGKLEAHLKEVRARGFATDFEEFAKHLYCVAVPVPRNDAPAGRPGTWGAIGLGTTDRSPAEALRRLIQLARGAAERAAAAL